MGYLLNILATVMQILLTGILLLCMFIMGIGAFSAGLLGQAVDYMIAYKQARKS